MLHRAFLLEVTPSGFVPKPASALDPELARAGAADAPRCARLWGEVGRGFWSERGRWSPARWRRHLERPDTAFWIAGREGSDMGFFELRQRGASARLEGFGLLPAWRGRGLGGLLLTAATQRAFAAGATRVWLHTATDDHPHALPNYRARGYRIYRELPLRHPLRSPGSAGAPEGAP